jgi:DNA polymerase-3 subunit beta
MEEPRLHVVVDRATLLTAIQAAEAVAPASSTKPILTNLLLRATPAGVEVVATDSQVGLRCLAPGGRVEIPGEVVIGARQIGAILKESSSPAVTLRMARSGDQHVVEISLADGDYQVQAVVGETFPEVGAYPDGAVGHTVPGARLHEMFRATTLAMDKDRASPVLSGLSVSVGDGKLVLAATDGKVLAESIDLSDRYQSIDGKRLQIVLPALTVNHLGRVLSGDIPAKVEFTSSGKVVFFRLHLADGQRMDITSRLIDGTFASYAAAIAPVPGAATVTFQASELASAVRRTALMTNQSARGIVMALEKDRAIFSNLNFTNGSARIPVNCQYAGSPVRLGFNSSYLGDVIKAYHGETITIELGRGMVMRQPGCTFLVMPITLPN